MVVTSSADPARGARARRAAEDAAARLGLDATGARLVREGSAVLVELPDAGALARVDDRAGLATAARQATVARLLALAEVPAVRLVGDGQQPVVVTIDDGSPIPVTCWRWEREADRRPDPAELGALARRLHDATDGIAARAGRGADVPVADPLAAVVERLAALPPADPDGDVLVAAAQRLAPSWAALADGSRSVVHADLHVGNVLVTDRGLLLADLELAGIGPSAYDLAPAVVAVRRYGAPPTELDAFLDGYGSPLPPAEVLEPLVEVYELWVTAWAVLNRDLDPAHRDEAALRMARWRGASTTERWTLR